MRLVAAMLLLALGCAPTPPGWQDPGALDRTPPYLLSVTPGGDQVLPSACFALRFSEPLEPASLAPVATDGLAGVVLLHGQVTAETLERVGDSEAPDEEQSSVVGASTRPGEADQAVILCPDAPLLDETEYTLVATRRLTDLARNPLCRGPDDPATGNVAVSLRTTFAGPRVLSLDPADGAMGVPPNLPSVTVRFDRPVVPNTLTTESFTLHGPQGSQVPVLGFEVEDAGSMVRALLSPARLLALDAEHAVRLTTGIRSVEHDRPLVAPYRARFTTADALDEAPPVFVGDPVVAAEDIEALLAYVTDEPATTVIDFGEPGQPGTEVILDDLVYERLVRLFPLVPEQDFEVRVTLADAVGNRSVTHTIRFRSGAPRGRPVITEVMANPEGTAEVESAREYVELYNAGTAAVDLEGYRLDDRADQSGADPMTLFEGSAGSLLLSPGQFAVVVTTTYDGRYELPPGTLLLAVDDGRLGADGLSRDESVELYPADPGEGAVPVSTYGGWISASREGASVERIQPLAPDEAGSWRLRAAGGSPGAAVDP